jgi:tetratricopeptide (TPR) repeat protein
MSKPRSPTRCVIEHLGFALVLIACASCAASSQMPRPTHAGTGGNPKRAHALATEALGVIESNPARAEDLLRAALKADPYDGPAHNDLGVLFLRQSRLYEAATEFEAARKLMPGSPDPRLNLGLTFERAGLYERAFTAYDAALEAWPAHIRTIEAIARLTLRTGRTSDRLPGMLEDIALRGETSNWRSWAKEQMSRLKR